MISFWQNISVKYKKVVDTSFKFSAMFSVGTSMLKVKNEEIKTPSLALILIILLWAGMWFLGCK